MNIEDTKNLPKYHNLIGKSMRFLIFIIPRIKIPLRLQRYTYILYNVIVDMFIHLFLQSENQQNSIKLSSSLLEHSQNCGHESM